MKFKIGQTYTDRNGRKCEVVDILKTYNSKNELVKIRYVATHELMGQKVMDYDVLEITITRSLVEVA